MRWVALSGRLKLMNSVPSSSAATRSGGFTLVEVMIALAIVALTVPALLLTLNQQIDSTAYLREKSMASLVANNRLVELRLALRTGQRRLTGTLTGSETMADREWFWSVSTEATEVTGFSRVEVSVSSNEDEGAANLHSIVAFLAVDSQDG